MPGVDPDAALEAFMSPLQSVLDLLSPGSRFSHRHLKDGSIHVATPAVGVPLTTEIGVHVVMRVVPLLKLGEHAVSTRDYKYTIYQGVRQRETSYMWHWHPDSRQSPIQYPHIHIPPGAYLSTKHFPTGRVAFEDIALFAIDELKLKLSHPEARGIIATHRTVHAENRTWH